MSIKRIGKFETLGTLGNGAHSTILHIRRADDGQPYALKVVPLDDEDDVKFLEQARLEWRIGQMLDHPNLVRIYFLEEQKDWFFRVRKVNLLLEFVEGKPFDALPPLPPVRLVPMFLQMAHGLWHMHRCGVFHADFKPNNVMLGRGSRVKIIDFGLSAIRGEPKDRVQGTPEYMAPETVKTMRIDERSDIFNFGATMYKLATLRNPPSMLPRDGTIMDGKTWRALLIPACEANDKIPESLGAFIHDCMAYKADQRPVNMSAVVECLEQLSEELTEHA